MFPLLFEGLSRKRRMSPFFPLSLSPFSFFRSATPILPDGGPETPPARRARTGRVRPGAGAALLQAGGKGPVSWAAMGERDVAPRKPRHITGEPHDL